MYTLLIVFYVLVAATLIGLVLIQQGKGADAGAAFGSGSSGTVFGSRGSANFLTRATAWLATVFFILSLALAYVVHGRSSARSVVEDAPLAPTTPAAAVPATTPAAATPVTGDAAGSQSGVPAAGTADVPAKPEQTTPKVPQ